MVNAVLFFEFGCGAPGKCPKVVQFDVFDSMKL